MSTAALALALGAAVLHASWNLLLARADDPRAAAAAALAVALVAFAPVAALAGSITTRAWPYIGASAALEAAYYLLLSGAYRGGALSAVYPVARGAAPILVLLAGLAGVGGGASAVQVVGVVVAGAGIVAVQRGGDATASRKALALALATAATIAAYTVVDRAGLDHADPLPYLWLVLTPSAVAVTAGVALVALG
jgi:uncharacterized membrane protein